MTALLRRVRAALAVAVAVNRSAIASSTGGDDRRPMWSDEELLWLRRGHRR